MTETLAEPPDLLADAAYFPRITQHDGRAIEDAMASDTLFDPGVRLQGAVFEATYANSSPLLLKRLREENVPRLIDPQSVRFTTERYLEIEALRTLPYAPETPITSDRFDASRATEMVRSSLLFQQSRGVNHYVVPALPLYDKDFQKWLRHNDAILRAASSLNGSSEIDRRPLIAQVAPGPLAITRPDLIVNRLMDYPINGVYVQPLNLNPNRDSPEKLGRYVTFLKAIADEDLGVIASRVGAFGLVLQSLGITAFDSGLGLAEASNLAQLNRPLTERDRKRQEEGKTAGPGKRIYFEHLKTTLQGRHANLILSESHGLRGRFACPHGCCRFHGIEALPDRRRQHFLWTRDHEVTQVREKRSANMRMDLVHEWLLDAREAARYVRRASMSKGFEIPRFDHLDSWIGVMGRELEIRKAA